MLGGPIVKNKAFFFVDYEGFRQAREQRGLRQPSRRAAQRQGILSVAVREPASPACVYPAGTPIPDDALRAARSWRACRPRTARHREQLRDLQELTNDTDKYGGKVDEQISPRLGAFGRFG